VVEMMARLSGALARRGVTLVYMPIPNRGMTDADKMPGGIADGVVYDGHVAEAQFHETVATFRSAGVATVDILQSVADRQFAGEFHFARDIHWRPEGARAGAEAVAGELTKVAAFEALTKKGFASTDTGEAELASPMRSALQSLCTDKLDVETLHRFQTDAAEISADDLLGGDESEGTPVAIVGTSYSDLPEFNFEGFLKEALQTDVANYAISGGGTFTAIMQWTHSDLMDGALPKFLLWENPVAYRLDGEGITAFRQLIPAVEGSCAGNGSLHQAALTLRPGEPARVDLPETVSVAGHTAYLAMQLSDPTVRTLKISLDHRDGDGEDVAITRPDRMGDTDRAFLELSDDFAAPLGSITISAPVKAETTLTLDICKSKGA
jgi:alginate biosynthesis protein AlgX